MEGKRLYSIRLLGAATDLATRQETSAGAMGYAVRMAFRAGRQCAPEEIYGQFVCVYDDANNEVFRTPLAAFRNR
jgi:hypothetical protein